MKKSWSVMCALMLSVVCHAEPKFENYPVSVYKGKRALQSTPLTKTLATEFQRMKSAPIDFAGVYTIGDAGCGTGCYVQLFLNVRTGKPVSFSEQMGLDPNVSCSDGTEGSIDVRADSRLMVVRGADGGGMGDALDCLTEYYVEKNGKLQKLP